MSKHWPACCLILVALFALVLDRAWSARGPFLPAEVAYLEDPDGRLDILRAASPGNADRYVIKKDNRLSLGFSRSALWVRLALDDIPLGGPFVLVVAAPWMDRVDLFLPDPEKGWGQQTTGLLTPGNGVAPGGFALTGPADTPRIGFGYLRLESVLALNAGLRILTRGDFDRQVMAGAYFSGGLYGIILAMIAINLMVLLTTRDRVYLYYVSYLLTVIVHQFCLQGQILLLPRSYWPLVPNLSLVVTALVFFFGAAFCRSFLDSQRHAPLADRFMFGVQVLAVVLLVLALTGQLWYGTWLTHSLAVISPLAAIAAGVQAARKGYLPARIYLVAWIVLLLGLTSWGAWSMGLLDRLRPPQMTLCVAVALESCLLTLALAERVRGIQQERQIIAQRERRYHQLSITDELTGLFNQRYFRRQLAEELEHALCRKIPLSLVLLDLDDFKKVNDDHGHRAGDLVLAETGHLLRKSVRPNDSPCRYGGEEFALILPGADLKAAMEVAERVRRGMAEKNIQAQPDKLLNITISLGATRFLPGDDANTLFQRADQYLYQAKALGKNRVVGG